MSPSLRQLEYLVAVADTGGLTAAADSCHVSQSAVSLAIASLERTLGVQLILRGPGRTTALTDAYRQVVGEARAVLTSVAELGAAARDYGRDLAGRLNFGCYTPLAPLHVPAALATFRAQHPEVDVSFVEGTLPDLQHLLLEGRCDLAVLYRQDLMPGIAADTLYDQPPSVLLPLAHPLARRKTVSLRALAERTVRPAGRTAVGTLFPGRLRRCRPADAGRAPDDELRTGARAGRPGPGLHAFRAAAAVGTFRRGHAVRRTSAARAGSDDAGRAGPRGGRAADPAGGDVSRFLPGVFRF